MSVKETGPDEPKPEEKRRGRKPSVPSKFKQEEFEKLLAMQHTREECAAWFAFSPASLDRQIKKVYGRKANFEDIRKPFLDLGKARLRAALWTGALKGNASLIRLLASSQLGIRERFETREDEEQLKAKLANDRMIAEGQQTTMTLEAQRVAAAMQIFAMAAKQLNAGQPAVTQLEEVGS